MASLTTPQPPEPPVYEIAQGASGTYTGTLTDDSVPAVAIPAASLLTLTLRLFVQKADGTLSYIRGTLGAGQNVLNANNVTVDANGLLTWSIQPADTTLVETPAFERHVAIFEWTWSSGKNGKHTIVLNVQNLTGV